MIIRYLQLYNIAEATNSIDDVLESVAMKYKMTIFDGMKTRINNTQAARRFVLDFRDGLLGTLTLDPCSNLALEHWASGEDHNESDDEFGYDYITHIQIPKRKETI